MRIYRWQQYLACWPTISYQFQNDFTYSQLLVLKSSRNIPWLPGYTRFCRVSIETRIDESMYIFFVLQCSSEQSHFYPILPCELKIQTRDIGAYWFCKYKTRAKTLRINKSSAVLFNSRRYKTLEYFFQYFWYNASQASAILFVPRKINITCWICFPVIVVRLLSNISTKNTLSIDYIPKVAM